MKLYFFLDIHAINENIVSSQYEHIEVYFSDLKKFDSFVIIFNSNGCGALFTYAFLQTEPDIIVLNERW